MANMSVYLRFRPRLYLVASSSVHSSSPISHFSSSSSSSSSSDSSDETPQNRENTQTSSRDAFSDVLANLKGNARPQFQQPPRPGFTYSQRPRQTPPSSVDFDEIRKNLSEFSQRSPNSSVPFQRSQGQSPLSFQSMYKHMSDKSSESRGFSGKDTTQKLGIDSIRNLMPVSKQPTQGIKSPRPVGMSLANLKDTLKRKPEEGSNAAGDDSLKSHFPGSLFQRELSEKPKKVADTNELFREYSKDELGVKLRDLRPEGQISFSLTELNERLIKLRELEQVKSPSRSMGGLEEIRKTLKEALPSETDNRNYNPAVGLFLHRDATKDYMLLPPKENLVEQYHHPDNMSSAEKLKLKLKAVRDEFKMSETDCGSPRVQIAQLTTEILHLSKVLHKKDKHSLKGLLAKVQLRKKLLKYLRRTDWDSYCFILSKLGLRDNPGYKQH